MGEKSWPTTLSEAVGVVLASLSENEKAEITSMPESDLFKLHFGLGAWIRGNLGLWHGNAALTQALLEADPQLSHPDDASMFIVKEVWVRLREMAPKVH